MSRGGARAVAGLAVVAVLGGGGWLLASLPREDDVSWTRARVDDLVIGVDVEGTLQSLNSSFLGPPAVPDTWDYKISMLAPEGSTVEAGTPVLGFDSTELERRLRERLTERDEATKKIEQVTKDVARRRMEDELKLAEARAREHKARLKAEVPAELEKGRTIDQALLDLALVEAEVAHLERRLESSRRSAEATLDVLRTKKERADQQVREIRESIERMTVTAPRAGTVIHVSNWRGEKKRVGDSCWRDDEIIELPDLEAMVAKGEVDEASAGRIVEGQPVRIRLDAHPDVEYAGNVGSIGRTVQRKSWRNPIKVVRLDIELGETDTRRMRPSMRFRGTVEVERVAGALVIPAHAVFPTPEGPTVYRKTWTGHERVLVRLGRRNVDLVQVVDGLAEGDKVAGQDLDRRDGSG